MNVDPELKQAIMQHPSDDVVKVARDVSHQLRRQVHVGLVVKIRGTMQRSIDVNRARENAAGTLDAKVERIESASGVLEKLFHDEALPLKDRIEASKELRQWTKLGMDAAGIADADNDMLFVVEGSWDPTPTA